MNEHTAVVPSALAKESSLRRPALAPGEPPRGLSAGNTALSAAVLDFERRLTESRRRLGRKRVALRDLSNTRPRRLFARTRTLIVGTGPLAETIAAHLAGHPAYSLVGCVDSMEKGADPSHQLDRVVARERVGCVVVALPERRGALPMEVLLACKTSGIRVEDGAAFLEKISGKIPLAGLNPGTLVFSDGFRWPAQALKRSADILLASLFLLLSAPVFLLLPLLIKLSSPGPVFYRQERTGLNGCRFTILKFRSMVQNAEGAGSPVWARENDPRVTTLGRLMRLLRLDELPQLLNVLFGDMSFVGPRPERPQFVELLRKAVPYYDLRHAVKPGITGWAQVRFRYGASIEDAAEKLQYDLYYIKHMSIVFDFRIALKTFQAVLLQAGAR